MNALRETMNIHQWMLKKVSEAGEGLKRLLVDEACLQNIEKVSLLMIEAIKRDQKILICGNGGSAADAQHFSAELLGRFYKDRRPLAAVALTTDTSTLTAIGNDYSYEEIFSRQVEGLGREGDVLLGIRTSGSSQNVLRALMSAKKKGMASILLTGTFEREAAPVSDFVIKVPSTDTPRIQEMHLLVVHLICEMIERSVLDVI